MADVTSGADTLRALRQGELAGATTLRIAGGIVGNRFERLPQLELDRVPRPGRSQ